MCGAHILYGGDDDVRCRFVVVTIYLRTTRDSESTHEVGDSATFYGSASSLFARRRDVNVHIFQFSALHIERIREAFSKVAINRWRNHTETHHQISTTVKHV